MLKQVEWNLFESISGILDIFGLYKRFWETLSKEKRDIIEDECDVIELLNSTWPVNNSVFEL